MEAFTLLLILLGFAVVVWYIRYEANQRAAREKCQNEVMRAALEGMIEGFSDVVNARAEEQEKRMAHLRAEVEQNRRVLAAGFEATEKGLVRTTLKLTRYPVVPMREKGTGKWSYLAIAAVIDPSTGQVMPGTPATPATLEKAPDA